MELSLATRTVAEHTVLEVGGEVDVYTAPRLRERLVELVDSGARDVVVDLAGVEFLDSTGLGVLVGGLKKVRAHDGSLQLVCSQERLLKIFRITGLAKVFVIHESADEVRRIARAFADTLTGMKAPRQLGSELRQASPQGTTQGSLLVPKDHLTLPILQ